MRVACLMKSRYDMREVAVDVRQNIRREQMEEIMLLKAYAPCFGAWKGESKAFKAICVFISH